MTSQTKKSSKSLISHAFSMHASKNGSPKENHKNLTSPNLSSSRQIIFLGNGPLADSALAVLENSPYEVIFHARSRDDLETVKKLKRENPAAHAVLASFGSLIKSDILELFEPEGILNIHPSKLPDLRGPSPIETAILRGDTDFSVSVIKLAQEMDAGPLYYQTTLRNLTLEKSEIYQALAKTGAEWIVKNLENLPEPILQNDQNATFSHKFEKKDGLLDPGSAPAAEILRKIIAFQNFPKPKLTIMNHECIILKAHLAKPNEKPLIPVVCADGKILSIDLLQPAGKKPMDAKSFLNGYGKK